MLALVEIQPLAGTWCAGIYGQQAAPNGEQTDYMRFAAEFAAQGGASMIFVALPDPSADA